MDVQKCTHGHKWVNMMVKISIHYTCLKGQTLCPVEFKSIFVSESGFMWETLGQILSNSSCFPQTLSCILKWTTGKESSLKRTTVKGNIPILPEAFLTFASKSCGPSDAANYPSKWAKPCSQINHEHSYDDAIVGPIMMSHTMQYLTQL